MTDEDMAVRDRRRQLAEVTTVDLESELEEMKIMPTVELKRLFVTPGGNIKRLGKKLD